MNREEWLCALGRELEARGCPELRAEVQQFITADWQPSAVDTPAAAADLLIGLADWAATPPPTDPERWVSGDNPTDLLRLVRPRTTPRKLRMFACACCRRIWPLLRDQRARIAVEVAERYADAEATLAELNAARQAVEIPLMDAVREAHPAEIMGSQSDPVYQFVQAYRAAVQAASLDGSEEIYDACESAAAAIHHLDDYREDFPAEYATIGVSDERLVQVSLLRCVFGNPFHPIQVDPAWLTWNGGTVVDLARAIRGLRAFEGLPILADALEEAGCCEQDILAHCRGPGPHALGCWITDLILGHC